MSQTQRLNQIFEIVIETGSVCCQRPKLIDTIPRGRLNLIAGIRSAG